MALDSSFRMITPALLDDLLAEQKALVDRMNALAEAEPLETRSVVSVKLAALQGSLAVDHLNVALRLMAEKEEFSGAV